MCTSETERKEPGMQAFELPRWLMWSYKTRATSTGSSVGSCRTERTGRCGPERGPASGARIDLPNHVEPGDSDNQWALQVSCRI
jgi:hypothetical protein